MTNPDPQLAALITDVTELTGRIGALARELDREPTDRAAVDLFESERALRTAGRRMEAARRQLGRLG